MQIKMYLIGRKHNQLSSDSRESFFFIRREHLMSSREESVKIADGSSRSKNGVTDVPTYQLAHLLQDDMLHQNKHGCDLVSEHVCVRSRS